MIIKHMTISNFRAFYGTVQVDFDSNLTALIGANDIGKSSILEALDIFFNEGHGEIKPDKQDLNLQAREDGIQEFVISVVFSDLPQSVILDKNSLTSLEDEFLLNQDGELEIIKKYADSSKEKVFIKAYHPSCPECKDLLSKTNKNLKDILSKFDIDCDDKTNNTLVRRAIRKHFSDDLQLQDCELEMNSTTVSKSIWEPLKKYLPIFNLFQADRKNSDSDDEVQDPLKYAIKELFQEKEVVDLCQKISNLVLEHLHTVSEGTINKLREMAPDLAQNLSPVIPSVEALRWTDVFKNVSIYDENNIPINKRGSGTRRLVLLNFFRAEVERTQYLKEPQIESSRNVIYAIEEPETALHFDYQKKLIETLSNLAASVNTQVVITTHSSTIVKHLKHDNLRLIYRSGSINYIKSAPKSLLPNGSLNEANYVAFGYISEEYHNELFGFLEESLLLDEFSKGKEKQYYYNTKLKKKQKLIKTQIIRHQIHHPETCGQNQRFTEEDLKMSIESMREFLQRSDLSRLIERQKNKAQSKLGQRKSNCKGASARVRKSRANDPRNKHLG